MSHISVLPPEIFLYILKWVVSQDLDVHSLEQVSKVNILNELFVNVHILL